MDNNSLRHKAATKYTLLSTFLLLLAVLLFFFLKHATEPPDLEKPPAPGQSEAELSINRFRHTATRQGRTEWTLEADSAEYFSDSRVRLKSIALTFFPSSDQPETHLTAEKGLLDLKTHDMDISGNIIVENRRYRLETEILHYCHESHIIATKTPAHIEGQTLALNADTMTFNLKSGKMECLGDVKGTLSGQNNFNDFR